MALKIVQTIAPIAPTISIAATSDPIVLSSGYIRISAGSTGACVAIGTDPVATASDFHIPPWNTEVLKERLARQKIAGITTGTTTIVSFGQNLGNVFEVGDYVSIREASPAGINTTHVPVLSVTASSVEIGYNSSSVTGVSVSDNQATLAKSVKVSAIATGGAGANVSICEVVQLVSE
jgi:hypothetical protein